MRRILLLLIITLLLTSCTAKPADKTTTSILQQTSSTLMEEITKANLIPTDSGLEVQNSGTTTISSLNLKFKTLWFAVVADETKESSAEFNKNITMQINPGAKVKLTDINSCLPLSQKGQYSIYKCMLVLSNNGNVLDEKTIFISYARGQNQGEDKFQLIDEADYESVREYLAGKI